MNKYIDFEFLETQNGNVLTENQQQVRPRRRRAVSPVIVRTTIRTGRLRAPFWSLRFAPLPPPGITGCVSFSVRVARREDYRSWARCTGGSIDDWDDFGWVSSVWCAGGRMLRWASGVSDEVGAPALRQQIGTTHTHTTQQANTTLKTTTNWVLMVMTWTVSSLMCFAGTTDLPRSLMLPPSHAATLSPCQQRVKRKGELLEHGQNGTGRPKMPPSSLLTAKPFVTPTVCRCFNSTPTRLSRPTSSTRLMTMSFR